MLVRTSSHYLKKMCRLIDLFAEARYSNKTCTSSNHRKKEARAQSADSSKAYSEPKAFNSRALCFPTTRRQMSLVIPLQILLSSFKVVRVCSFLAA